MFSGFACNCHCPTRPPEGIPENEGGRPEARHGIRPGCRSRNVSDVDHTEQNGTDGDKPEQDAGSLRASFERQYCYVLSFGLIAVPAFFLIAGLLLDQNRELLFTIGLLLSLLCLPAAIALMVHSRLVTEHICVFDIACIDHEFDIVREEIDGELFRVNKVNLICEARNLVICIDVLTKRIKPDAINRWLWVLRRGIASKMLNYIEAHYIDNNDDEHRTYTKEQRQCVIDTHPLLIAKKPEKGWDKRNDASTLSREDMQIILRRIMNAEGE
jgi:hypothetical protein